MRMATRIPTLPSEMVSPTQNQAHIMPAKVAIEAKPGGKGRIVIAYSSLDELDGIVAKLR